MSFPDMPPQKPPAVIPLERIESWNGAGPTPPRDAPCPTAEQATELTRKVVQAIRDDARKAKEASERAAEAMTPPDGSTIVLRADSKIVRRLRELRDEAR